MVGVSKAMNWDAFLEEWNNEGGHRSDGTYSNIVKSAVLSYWGCREETPAVKSQQAIAEDTYCVENGHGVNEEVPEDDDDDDDDDDDEKNLEDNDHEAGEEEDEESLSDEEDVESLNDEEDEKESLNDEGEQSINDPEESDDELTSGSSTQRPLAQSRPPRRNNRMPTMSKEVIAREKEMVWGLATLYSTRNAIVHTGIEKMEGQELYTHLRELENLIEEETAQFDQEELGNILVEAIENLVDEFFEKNERTGEIVARGSNTRVVVGAIPVTGEKEQEDGLDDGAEAGTSQNVAVLGLLGMQGKQELLAQGGNLDAVPYTGNETGDGGVNRRDREGFTTGNDMGSGDDRLDVGGVTMGNPTGVSGKGDTLRRLAYPQWCGKRTVFS
jgi:hypothetical protein